MQTATVCDYPSYKQKDGSIVAWVIHFRTEYSVLMNAILWRMTRPSSLVRAASSTTRQRWLGGSCRPLWSMQSTPVTPMQWHLAMHGLRRSKCLWCKGLCGLFRHHSCFPFYVFFKTHGETERLPFTLAFVLEGFQPGDELLLGEPGATCSPHCLNWYEGAPQNIKTLGSVGFLLLEILWDFCTGRRNRCHRNANQAARRIGVAMSTWWVFEW